MESRGQKPAAVFITSPTYHGICSNLKEIADLCHSQDIPLIVDEAHGAHFGFHLELPLSALQQGADVAVQSTHKVLCSLTQSSMLHLSGKLVDRGKICRSLQTLQSTSPSYLLLASLDAAVAQLREDPTIFDNVINFAMEAKTTIEQIRGLSVLDFPNFSEFPAIDPLRVTLGFYDLSISGYEADDFLFNDQRVISELTGSHSVTFPFTIGTCREHVDRLILGVKNLSSSFHLHQRKKEGTKKHGDLKPFQDISVELTPREAFFANKRRITIEDSIGKVCGELICPYPPGIPVMIPGERISERALSVLLQAKACGATLSGASDPDLSSMVICDD